MAVKSSVCVAGFEGLRIASFLLSFPARTWSAQSKQVSWEFKFIPTSDAQRDILQTQRGLSPSGNLT
jgi:hypothetical protein